MNRKKINLRLEVKTINILTELLTVTPLDKEFFKIMYENLEILNNCQKEIIGLLQDDENYTLEHIKLKEKSK